MDNAIVAALDGAKPAGRVDDSAIDHASARDYGADAGRYDDSIEDDDAPSDAAPLDEAAMAIVEECAGLDPSDTDNGRRLIKHRGADLAVLMEAGGKASDSTWHVWNGKHWDGRDGAKQAIVKAQQIGALIAAEAEFLTLARPDRDFIVYDLPRLMEELADNQLLAEENREALRKRPEKDERAELMIEREEIAERIKDLKQSCARGDAAMADLAKRQGRRRAFGVTSKNAGRIASMLQMAAPHLVTEAEAWDAQQRLVYVGNGALRFTREPDEESDPATPRFVGKVAFVKDGWRREDRVTRLCPTNYNPDAKCEEFQKFLARMMPDPQQREALQIFTGAGLTGVPIQKLMFHYGSGANGKSVFLETVMRVLGPLAEGLPPTSITGSGERGAGGASPDLAKLYGARFVRITELPQGDPLREELVKALTGGEKIDVRTLFKGYFSFQPQFKAHMSGNGYPTISGSDNGIWRRILMMPWPVELAEQDQRDFEEMVCELVAEREGILAWLVEGMRLYDTHGLIVTEAMVAAKKEFRDVMDPIPIFFEQCVAKDGSAGDLRATDLYEAYCNWSLANARKPFNQHRFGRVAGQRYKRKATRDGTVYCDIRLHDVPSAPATRHGDGPPPHHNNPLDEE